MIDKVEYIKPCQASRIYHPKCKIYQCGVTFEIRYKSGTMTLFYVPYVSDDVILHHFICDLIDKGYKFSFQELGIIWGLISSLTNHLTSENRGDNK